MTAHATHQQQFSPSSLTCGAFPTSTMGSSDTSFMHSAATYAAFAGLAVLSLLLANALAAALEAARGRRIERKLTSFAAAAAATAASTLPAPIPVTLLTGFLGAGKTVLLNRLLSDAGGRRICVIENEAGAISIDHSLLKLAAAEDAGAAAALSGVVVLANGCMCCSSAGAGDELERVLDKLVAIDGSVIATGRVDAVVIECSGAADPAPIIATLLRTELARRFVLDAVVAVVDAKHVGALFDGEGRLPAQVEAGRQVAFADVVLLNKMDLVGPAPAAAARDAVRAINPTAQLLECSFGNVLPSVAAAIMGRGAYAPTRAGAAVAASSVSRHPPALTGGHSAAGDTAAGHGHSHGSHTGDISAITIDLRGVVVDFEGLTAWLVDLARVEAVGLLRVKGLVRAAKATPSGPWGPASLCVLHGVRGDLHVSALAATGGEAGHHGAVDTALVIIGRALDEAAVLASFRARVRCLAAEEGEAKKPRPVSTVSGSRGLGRSSSISGRSSSRGGSKARSKSPSVATSSRRRVAAAR